MISTTNERTPSLEHLSTMSESVKDIVDQCASDLAAVNGDIARELSIVGHMPAIERALCKNMKIEDNAQEAAEKLAGVTRGLEHQSRDRRLLEHRFAAVVEQEEAARHAALYDALTDLPNRALFDDRLEHALAQALRHGWTLAVMFIDLDDFKGINDLFGHAIGDRVLQAIGRRLRDCTRGDDTVSRYGGDEFLYLAMEIEGREQIALVARKIIDAIRQPWGSSDEELDGLSDISASVGIAIFPHNGVDAGALVKRADAAMYVAKRSKAGYAFADLAHDDEPADIQLHQAR
ncbi:MAG: GGDEF domain-containing protein [Dokdonella sp.]|uniref:GGDEF domain-containing protein n=1 Tax=Dokdonella sp. TaxID=2291710 RepID=UPI003264B99F